MEATHWIRGLANEIRLSENILVLNRKSQQRKTWIKHGKFATFIAPFWTESIIHDSFCRVFYSRVERRSN